ncbi:MAG TPA: CBS domain-containing protein [Solirubrobacteraceae bacterium]|nr:CBS domain-containing protein [Solirubrobacteraceae bacterium]
MPSLEHARVADVMHAGIVAAAPDMSLTQVARLMATHHVHCVAVGGISSAAGGESLVWGIISDIDLLRAGLGTDSGDTAASMAVTPVVTVEPVAPLRDAGELMLSHGASHLVVVDPKIGRPVGLLSTLDIAGVLAWGEA